MKQLSQEYLDYIASDAWRRRRALKLMLAGGLSGHVACELCRMVRSVNRVDVHHATYENFGAEKMADLSILCRTCHDRIEEIEAVMFGGQVESISDVLLERLSVIDPRLVEQPDPPVVAVSVNVPRTTSPVSIGDVAEIIKRKRLEQGIEH